MSIKHFEVLALKKQYLCKKKNCMARIMALDYGTKRTGVAVTDDLQLIASGLTTVDTSELFSFLGAYFAQEDVTLVLMGEPKQKDGSASQSEVAIQTFLKKFAEKFPGKEVKRIDERFTSKMAFQTMIDSGLKKKQRRNKALIDEISATIILQTYLYK